MLVNFSNVQNIFIVCGHTDMRCGIDGLAGIITDKYNLDLFNDALFLFCGRKKIDSKPFIGIKTVLSYYINGLRRVTFNGQETKKKSKN